MAEPRMMKMKRMDSIVVGGSTKLCDIDISWVTHNLSGMGYKSRVIYNNIIRGSVRSLSKRVKPRPPYSQARYLPDNKEGPLRTSARTAGMKSRARKIREFLLIFSFVSPWIRRRSKRKILIGSMAVFSFDPKERIPTAKHER